MAVFTPKIENCTSATGVVVFENFAREITPPPWAACSP